MTSSVSYDNQRSFGHVGIDICHMCCFTTTSHVNQTFVLKSLQSDAAYLGGFLYDSSGQRNYTICATATCSYSKYDANSSHQLQLYSVSCIFLEVKVIVVLYLL